MATIQNGTWTLEDLPPAIPLRWVSRIKRDAKGKFEKYKCRIVVKGYSQIAGLDFNGTVAPVVRIESIRVIFALATTKDLYILHIDCKNAFLHRESDVEIYVTQPEGFVDKGFPEKSSISTSPSTLASHLVSSPLWGGIRSRACGIGNGFLHSCSTEHPSCSLSH